MHAHTTMGVACRVAPGASRLPEAKRKRRRPSARRGPRLGALLAGALLAWPGALCAQDEPKASPVAPPVWQTPGAPPWPADAPAATAPIDVRVEVRIGTDGHVHEATLIDAAPAPFGSAALAFARTQRFTPARRDGEAVASRITLRVRFSPPPPSAETGDDAAARAQTATPDVDTDSPPDGQEVAAGQREKAPATAPQAAESSTRQDASAPQASAEQPTEAPAYGADARIEGGPGEAREVSASDFQIDVGALHDVPRQDAMQLLTLAPGIVLTNHAGEGHAYAVFLRGFDAFEGQDLEVRVAGIPINEPSNAHLHGYADTHFVIPELVHHVRVLEGPFDARQGDFAAAGTASFELAAQEPGVLAKASYGSFGRRRLLLRWSPSRASRRTFAAVDLTDGDGFGPNRAHGSVRALGQFAGEARHVDYRILLASHALRFDSVGVVREDAVQSREVQCAGSNVDPFYCFLDPNQGGHASRHLLSAEVGKSLPDTAWGQQVSVMFRDSRFRENFTGMRLDERGDGVDQQTQAITFVARGHYRVRLRVRDRPQVLELGYEGRYDRGDSRSWRVRREDQVPYARVFDNALALTRVSLYALGELSLLDWLGLELGLRSDSFGYAVRSRDEAERDREGERLPEQSMDAWGTNLQPRATLSLGDLRGLSWLTSFGIGSRSSDAAALSEGEDAPFTRIWAGESGLVYEGQWRQGHGEARSAFFYAHVDRDLLFDEARGRNVPVGSTNRYGAYVHGRLTLRERLDAMASFTWAEAYQGPAGFRTGPRLPFVPRFVARGDASYAQPIATGKGPLQLRGALGISWVGPRPLPLSTFAQPIFTLDAALRVRFRFIEVSVEGQNLTDRQNRSAEYFYASDFGTDGPTVRRVRHFSAAPPRRLMVSLALMFDPAKASTEEP